MKAFNPNESGYTDTATNVTFTGATNYDPAVLDNPERKKINYAVIHANVRFYKRGAHAL